MNLVLIVGEESQNYMTKKVLSIGLLLINFVLHYLRVKLGP